MSCFWTVLVDVPLSFIYVFIFYLYNTRIFLFLYVTRMFLIMSAYGMILSKYAEF